MVRGKDVVSLTTITIYVLMLQFFYDVIYIRILIYGNFIIVLNFEF